MKLDEPPHDWQGNFPVFIPPAASKRYQGIYSWTWWRALCDIAQAEKLLFVGYSFPLLDVVAREYIRRKLWGRNERTVDYVLPPQHRERIKHAIRHHKEDMSVRPNWIGECWEIGHFDQLLV
jgi:hypothetical protein